MVAQLTYDENPAIGFKGMISQNFTSPQMIESGLAEGAILIGDAVEAGTAPGQYAPLAAVADFAGVVPYFAGIEKVAGSSDPLALADGRQMPVMNRGRIFVVAGAAVVKGVQVVPSTGASTKFVTASGALTAKVRAVALTAAAADGDIIEIELSTQLLDTEA